MQKVQRVSCKWEWRSTCVLSCLCHCLVGYCSTPHIKHGPDNETMHPRGYLQTTNFGKLTHMAGLLTPHIEHGPDMETYTPGDFYRQPFLESLPKGCSNQVVYTNSDPGINNEGACFKRATSMGIKISKCSNDVE